MTDEERRVGVDYQFETLRAVVEEHQLMPLVLVAFKCNGDRVVMPCGPGMTPESVLDVLVMAAAALARQVRAERAKAPVH